MPPSILVSFIGVVCPPTNDAVSPNPFAKKTGPRMSAIPPSWLSLAGGDDIGCMCCDTSPIVKRQQQGVPHLGASFEVWWEDRGASLNLDGQGMFEPVGAFAFGVSPMRPSGNIHHEAPHLPLSLSHVLLSLEQKGNWEMHFWKQNLNPSMSNVKDISGRELCKQISSRCDA